MDKKKKLLITMAIMLGIVFVSGVSILAATNSGTQSDPLVTLSYLTNKFKPQILSELSGDITKAADEMTQKLETSINSFKTELETSQSGLGTAQTGKADEFSVVTLKKGQTVSCPIGAEIMLRIGTAEGKGSAPALVDSTAGTTLAVGAALTANHMYLVTIEGNGLKATADNVKVLIRGTYSVA